MNKVIMGLSCLGVLSAVSCDNDKTTTKTTTPLVEKVNFSAATGDAGIAIEAGDKVTLVVKKGEDFARYYTDSDRSTGKEFTADGKEFTLEPDGGVNGGFYLEASDAGIAYKITKFDIITKGGKKYELKDNVSFNLTKGTPANPEVTVVEKKDGSITGSVAPEKGEKTSFTLSKGDINQGTFNLTLKKSDGTLFNSTDDSDVTIMLDLKEDGTTSVSPFPVTNLFATQGLTEGSNKFNIALPREFAHYTNLGDLIATAKNSTEDAAVTHQFSKESGSAKDGGNVVLKIINNAPVITNNGADGNLDAGGYKAGDTSSTGTDDVFDVSNKNKIKVFTVTDGDKDNVVFTCEWTLYYITTPKFPSPDDKIETTKTIKNNDGTITLNEFHSSIDTGELDKYYLQANVTADDGLGGKVEIHAIFHIKNTP